MVIEQRSGREAIDPNLGGGHDDVLDDHRAIVQVAAGQDSRSRLATDTAGLADAVERPSDGPGKEPGRFPFLCTGIAAIPATYLFGRPERVTGLGDSALLGYPDRTVTSTASHTGSTLRNDLTDLHRASREWLFRHGIDTFGEDDGRRN